MRCILHRNNLHILAAAVLLVGLVAAAACMRGRGKMSEMGWNEGMESGQHSAPVREQGQMLASLGLAVDEDLIVRLETQAAEDPNARAYIEGSPYTILLSNMGFPKYDYSTMKVTAYPDGVYWFDWEAFDIPGCYEDLLLAVEHLSNGEVDFEQICFDAEKVDWDGGSGKLGVSLTCNGREYDFELEVWTDWMDTNVLQEIGRILKAEQTSGRLYVCGDNGQGAIVFYRDEAWRREFEMLTGLKLEEYR